MKSSRPSSLDIETFGELTDDALTANVRLWQRKRGHRYSLDDLLTADHACGLFREGERPRRYLDLGCGIGSVLLSVSDRLRPEECIGVEAQAISFAMVKENIRRNGMNVSAVHADHRDVQLEGTFDLITGTPPYKPIGTATPSPDPQRAAARMEMRGGVEAYLETAKRFLAPDGTMVLCGEAIQPSRVRPASDVLGFQIVQRVDCLPRAGRPALFSVWQLASAESPSNEQFPTRRFIARDPHGERTQAYLELRHRFGLGHLLRE